LEAQHDRRRRRRPAPRVKISAKNNNTATSLDHADEGSLIMETFGTADPAFVQGMVRNSLALRTKGRFVKTI
jgi:hypothetical protein